MTFLLIALFVGLALALLGVVTQNMIPVMIGGFVFVMSLLGLVGALLIVWGNS